MEGIPSECMTVNLRTGRSTGLVIVLDWLKARDLLPLRVRQQI